MMTVPYSPQKRKTEAMLTINSQTNSRRKPRLGAYPYTVSHRKDRKAEESSNS